MATYKVLQDIEAEDKLIGWMTPRQTIYAAIVIMSGFIWFMMAGAGAWWLGIIFLPHMILLTVLSGPFVHDQPSEVWLLAKIKFFLLPRRRIWDQSGIKELVTITAPKKVERNLTDGLSQTEVKSRLTALANTIDSRGWAIKNVNVNLFTQPNYAMAGSDRLLDSSAFAQDVPTYEVTAQDDILDERSNPTAQLLQHMIDQSAQSHRQQAVAQMQKPTAAAGTTQPADYWFLNATAGQQAASQQGQARFDNNQTVAPQTSALGTPTVAGPTVTDQEALLDKIHTENKKSKVSNKHLRTIKTLDQQKEEQAKKKQSTANKQVQERPAPSAAAQQLSQNNDLNVDVIARQANQITTSEDGEVTISLR